ncbi:hypothetical protein PSHT_07672 [Puccinia striiformis]|uniref:Uncharacterized protein n=1 Tax=Puccinia striiformis TaxID=27350 RepID=A0A2S4VV59_9BASI|nr:hypothetical protein PSHT_07672 [Puccinia striiformis]
MNSNQLKLTRSTAQPAPLLRLAAYGSLIITAFSALVALVLASYGLSAWDDAKHKLVGVRALVDRGFEVGKDIVDSVVSVLFQQLSTKNSLSLSWVSPTSSAVHSTDNENRIPSRNWSNNETTYRATSDSTRGYEVEDETEDPRNWDDDDNHKGKERASPRYGEQQGPTRLPPRPPLSILIASLLLTLIVLSARLMVVWWMGQQANKNSSVAYRNAQRAYQAAQQEEELQQDLLLHHSSASTSNLLTLNHLHPHQSHILNHRGT